jgi:pimeloyl-ACP methyl ester carboxylesterase
VSTAWRLTPWIARARLARLTRQRGRPLAPGEHVNWQIWGYPSRDRGRLWRTFLAEQRALVRELGQLAAAGPLVQAPVFLLADPADRLVPLRTARQLAATLPGARLQLVEGAGHHLPRRAPGCRRRCARGLPGITRRPLDQRVPARVTMPARRIAPRKGRARTGQGSGSVATTVEATSASGVTTNA